MMALMKCETSVIDGQGFDGVVQNRGRMSRARLPDDREALTKKIEIFGLDHNGQPRKFTGYVTVGFYPGAKRRLGEIFVRFHKIGGREGRMIDAWATMVSIALQSGVPLETIVSKFAYQRFEPSGMVNDSRIRMCTSLLDYIVRWLDLEFCDGLWTNQNGAGKPLDDLTTTDEEIADGAKQNKVQ